MARVGCKRSSSSACRRTVTVDAALVLFWECAETSIAHPLSPEGPWRSTSSMLPTPQLLPHTSVSQSLSVVLPCCGVPYTIPQNEGAYISCRRIVCRPATLCNFSICRLTALSALFSAFVCTGEECLSQVEGGREEQEGSGGGETLYRCCYAGRVSAKPTGELGFCEGVCRISPPNGRVER